MSSRNRVWAWAVGLVVLFLLVLGVEHLLGLWGDGTSVDDRAGRGFGVGWVVTLVAVIVGYVVTAPRSASVPRVFGNAVALLVLGLVVAAGLAWWNRVTLAPGFAEQLVAYSNRTLTARSAPPDSVAWWAQRLPVIWSAPRLVAGTIAGLLAAGVPALGLAIGWRALRNRRRA